MIYKNQFWSLFHNIFFSIINIGLLLFILGYLISQKINLINSFPWFQIVSYLFISLIWISFWVMWLIQMDKFVIIIGIDNTTNRNIILEILNNINWEIWYNNEKYLISSPSKIYKRGSTQLNILFDSKLIYINLVSFTTPEIRHPFYWIQNKKIKNKLINEINHRLKMHAT
jgi:hypothetical protein